MNVVTASNSTGVSDQVVNSILQRIKGSDPKMYAEILKRYKPAKQMAGIGDLMSDFGSAFNSVLNTASNLYVTKAQADIASDNAKQIAQQEITKGQQQLDAMRINAQNQYTNMQMAAEQQRLQQMQAEISSSDRNKMLLLAAGGLALVLGASVFMRKG